VLSRQDIACERPAAYQTVASQTVTFQTVAFWPSAKRLEQMPHAECAATEHAFEIKRRDEEDAESLASADSDYYGTLT